MSDCPQCGSTVVYEGLRTVECQGRGCENNPKPWRYIDPTLIKFLSAPVPETLPRMGGGYFPMKRMPVTYDTSGSMSKEDLEAFAKALGDFRSKHQKK